MNYHSIFVECKGVNQFIPIRRIGFSYFMCVECNLVSIYNVGVLNPNPEIQTTSKQDLNDFRFFRNIHYIRYFKGHQTSFCLNKFLSDSLALD